MTVTTSPVIDLLDPSSFANGQPHEQFRWLREHDPVHRHAEPDGPGFWALTRHRDVKAVGRDPKTFSSAPTTMIPDAAEMDLGGHQMMLFMDPPQHSAYRHILSGDFMRRAARALQPRIRELAATIIDGVIERGTCDLVEDIAGLMPSYVIAEMLGIPHADGVQLYRLTETIHAAPESVPEGAGLGAVIEMFNYAHQVWDEKRANPSDDLASKLVSGQVDGTALDEIDFNLYFLLLIDAGGDTTRNLVAGGMHALFEHEEELRRLHQDVEGLLPAAVEEMLRWVSPVVYMRRTATADAVIGGQAIEAGDKVVMYYGSANRDAEAFSEADRFDLSRHPNDHVAFGGGGPHFCLGAHIARIEAEATFREILGRLPDVEAAGPAEWMPSTFISGPKHLPVRFSKGQRRSS